MNIYWNDTNNTTHTIVKYNNYKTLPSNKYNNNKNAMENRKRHLMHYIRAPCVDDNNLYLR